MDKLQTISALSALAQDTRIDVFRLLVAAGPEGLPAGEIAEALGVRQNTMSANLSVLLHAGLVRNVREGRTVRYFADMEGMQGMLSFLLEKCCGGRAELCAPLLADLMNDNKECCE
ncbi:ArsR/SmtB family transcription factor [Chachezhania sediminis]|uniref:ArsR/SmtB family transcription factor n=1 Tax=Chachezhania sediminis TaxID=2599291 RepID=UPI00131CB227|nr:helix-turn-helix domain-containing protein [Chachezhania sediminis]